MTLAVRESGSRCAASHSLSRALRTASAQLRQRAGRPQHARRSASHGCPDGHPDLQGLWLKSAGGFQGLFIGSLEGTNLRRPAAAGAAGGRRPRAPPRRVRVHARGRSREAGPPSRGFEDPEARCHLPGVPRALDQPGGLYPVQIIQDEK